MTAPKPVRHLSDKELAERLGVHVRTIQNWRRDRIGPDWLKVGGTIRYRLADVEAWEKSRLAKSA